MSQSTKEMLIRLNGEVGPGVQKIGDTLTQLGYTLDRIGRYTREFEKESVSVYRNYEDEMLAAKYALSAQVESATELERQMDGLDQAARKWASTTIFHTDDVSKAINEAAHAGWEYQEILEGIPQAMLIAQAGGLDLSNGLDYLVKMMNATRTPMSQMGTVVDQWAMAANISATNIDELGQAFISMGAAAQFGDSTAELFSMLAALANVGTTGTKAGTALRNTIMRIIAPTTKAEAAMSLLGADAEELQEVLADKNVTKAAKVLEGIGFSAFDDKGNLKPVQQIFRELFELTEGLNEAARDEIIAAIFPTRTIATALSLLTSSNGELDEMYTKIKNSDGYAGKGAEIMMSGLTGSIETLKSKWEEFERTVGSVLAPHLENLAEKLGGFVDGLNSLDPATLEGITSMLSALSVAGPLLIGVGAVTKLVGLLGPVGSLALLAGMGVSYLYGYLSKMDQLNFEGKFGTLEVDIEELGKYVDGLESKFDVEQQAITKWSEAVTAAQENYNNALTGMNEGLLKKVLTGGTFTDEDYRAFTQLGNDIVKYTMDGIENAEARDLTLLQALFGDKETPEEIEGYDNMAGLLDYWYSDLSTEARQIGEEIRAKMTEALNNKELTAEDRQAIQAQIDRLNKINAEISAGLQEEAYYAQLEKAGRVSWDTVKNFLADNEAKLAEENLSIDDQYDAFWGRIKHAFELGRQNGDSSVTFTDANGVQRTVDLSATAEEEAHKLINEQRAQAHQSAADKYGGVSAAAFDALMRDSGFSTGWNYLKWMKANGIDLYTTDQYGNKEINWEGMKLNPALAAALSEQLIDLSNSDSSWGGLGKGRLTEILKPYADNPLIAEYIKMLDSAFEIGSTATGYLNGYSMELEEKQSELEEARGKQSQIESEIATRQARMENRDYGLFQNYHDDWVALYGENGEGGGLLDQKAQVDLDVTAAEQELAALEAQIKQPVTIPVNIESTSGGDFANGGRATTASIFGEAGPEWAIPEAHTERTARLLDAARRASGFTWGDIIGRFGGLNANPGSSPVVLNYSPVINAADASGVAGALAADKDRLIRMVREAINEARYRDAVEVYA